MIILPAIDLKDGQCVRLLRGDFNTAEVMAADVIETAKLFEKQGSRWLHMVDLDGAKDGKPANRETILAVRKNIDMHIEVGGGIRDMETVDFYIENGIDRVILGSAALNNPELVEKAVQKHGKKIAVGIDAKDGMVAAEGWLETSTVDYIVLAKEMEALGCRYLIVTDISMDGTLAGPNFAMLDRVNKEVSCNIIASGGISSIEDLKRLDEMGMYGTIAGKAIYSGALDLESAVVSTQKLNMKDISDEALEDNLERYFVKANLLPAIIQEENGEVLMMAYMSKESLKKTLETGTTWFYSRSRNALWNKGETSGHTQEVVSIHADCDDDTLLVKVRQKGAACHTGRHSCFYKEIT